MTAARRNGRLVGVAVLVVALVLVLLVAWFRHTFHRVEKTLYLPPTGEAARLLACTVAVATRRGHDAHP